MRRWGRCGSRQSGIVGSRGKRRSVALGVHTLAGCAQGAGAASPQRGCAHTPVGRDPAPRANRLRVLRVVATVIL